ncbi:hypothetical protein CGLAU_01840 [Corynebacterium glaucum]|uniref:Alkaline shock response membrane anchor protein AmaP n=1 Tax=Corynebacterium glaucum TaxID=187491 RepID=A0A1Q2HU29_9CORY|nr:hypothetical protein [Corynebacterium glaucum]AQQ14355.1 hypothetical protein CGLAU_01840 [Corynebacterium glaucum]
MTKTLAFFDRLIVFVLGLALLLAGLLPAALYWDIPYVSDFLGQLDRSALTRLSAASWYNTVLITTAIIGFILGLWILLANIRSRAFSNRAIAPADPAHGDTVINVQRLSEAACDALVKRNDAITKAESRVAMEGQRPTVTFTVTADPAYSFNEVITILENADEDFRMANDTMDIDTVWKFQLDRIAVS